MTLPTSHIFRVTEEVIAAKKVRPNQWYDGLKFPTHVNLNTFRCPRWCLRWSISWRRWAPRIWSEEEKDFYFDLMNKFWIPCRQNWCFFTSFMSFWLKVGIRERPLLVHCLSDTGIMCYQVFWGFQRYVARNAPRAGFNFSSQGLQLATRGKLDVRGVVWDSCPGPRPEITIPRFLMVALVFNWNWVTYIDWWIKSKFNLPFIGLQLF